MLEKHIGIIVLAAGASVRMGTPKQLLKIADVTMVRRAAQNAIDSQCRPVVMVLGSNADLIRPELDGLMINLAVNPEWEMGMSTSIRFGLKTLLAIAPETDAAILVLADQPALTGMALQKLTGAFAQNTSGLVVARYSGQLGTPALFAGVYFNELLNLDGKEGAKSLLRRHLERVLPIDLPEAALDLDTPEQFDCWVSKDTSRSIPTELMK
jgi:molybdenum cofactor cytidylyltransferase